MHTSLILSTHTHTHTSKSWVWPTIYFFLKLKLSHKDINPYLIPRLSQRFCVNAWITLERDISVREMRKLIMWLCVNVKDTWSGKKNINTHMNYSELGLNLKCFFSLDSTIRISWFILYQNLPLYEIEVKMETNNFFFIKIKAEVFSVNRNH